MLAKYAARVERLPPHARAALVEDLELDPSPRRSLVQMVERAGLLTCDVVRTLLCRGMVREAERVAGMPLTRMRFEPSRVAGKPGRVVVPGEAAPEVHSRAEDWGGRRVAWVNPTNPHPAGSDASLRYDLARVGVTRDQLAHRGVSRREMREWERRGWVDYE